MVKKFIKFIKKSPNRQVFEKVLQDIMDDNLDGYDIKPIKNKKGYFRLRVGSVRFIYKKTEHGNMLIDVNNRGDIYKTI